MTKIELWPQGAPYAMGAEAEDKPGITPYLVEGDNPVPVPVISFGEHGHAGSMNNLLGQEPDPDKIRLLSNELQVTEDTPPAFLWHTSDDASVPVENSLMFAAALSKCRIPFELHSYVTGHHGLGLAESHTEAQTWPDLCARWMRRMGYAPQ